MNPKSLELTVEKQVKFWAGDLTGYKASITGRQLYAVTDAFVGRKVLDVGAADGSLMRLVKQADPSREVTAVDLSPKSAEVLQADCTHLPFQDGQFDTIFITDVVEHLPPADLTQCLNEAFRVMSPGGHLILATLNNEDLTRAVIHCPHCDEHFHRWGHCQSFTPKTLTAWTDHHGFTMVKIQTLNLGLLARHPFVARCVYALGLSKIYKAATFHHDLILIARKTDALKP